MGQMTQAHEEHLGKLLEEIMIRVDEKYRIGQIEHGGKLWEKEGLLDEAINEAVDQLVYLLTLKEQLSEHNIR